MHVGHYSVATRELRLSDRGLAWADPEWKRWCWCDGHRNALLGSPSKTIPWGVAMIDGLQQSLLWAHPRGTHPKATLPDQQRTSSMGDLAVSTSHQPDRHCLNPAWTLCVQAFLLSPLALKSPLVSCHRQCPRKASRALAIGLPGNLYWHSHEARRMNGPVPC